MEMDLKSAASHAREAAERKRAEGCLECADEHLQLAAWLEELQAYKDTGLSPETVSDLLERFNSFYNMVDDLDLVDRVHFQAFSERVRRWNQAEKDGRLVVLPCKQDDELIRNGLTFKADHWNVLLTAFADDASTPSGKRVKLFSPGEAEAALAAKGKEDG